MAQCIENLPFSLTGDQQRALEDIRIDMEDELAYATIIAR